MKQLFAKYEVEFFLFAIVCFSGLIAPFFALELSSFSLLGNHPYSNVFRVLLAVIVAVVAYRVVFCRRLDWARGTLRCFIFVYCPVTVTAACIPSAEWNPGPIVLILLYLLLDAAILYRTCLRLESDVGVGAMEKRSVLQKLFEGYEVEFFLVALIYLGEGFWWILSNERTLGHWGYAFVRFLNLLFICKVVLCRSLRVARFAFCFELGFTVLLLVVCATGILTLTFDLPSEWGGIRGGAALIIIMAMAFKMLLTCSVLYRTCLNLEAASIPSAPSVNSQRKSHP